MIKMLWKNENVVSNEYFSFLKRNYELHILQ